MYRHEIPMAALELLKNSDFTPSEVKLVMCAHNEISLGPGRELEETIESIYNVSFPDELPVSLGDYQDFLRTRVATAEEFELIARENNAVKHRHQLINLKNYFRAISYNRVVPRDAANRWLATLERCAGNISQATNELLFEELENE